MNLEDLLPYQTDLMVLPEGKTLFTEGESGQQMYVLISGSVEVKIRGKLVETAGPGVILGELAIIDNSPRSATAVATTECTLLALDADRFRLMARELPDFALDVMRGMAGRLRRTGQLL